MGKKKFDSIAWRANHKDEKKVYDKIYCEVNKDKIQTYKKVYYQAHKEQWLLWLSSLLKLECAFCGFNRSFCALDFHHTDPLKKEYPMNEFWGKKCSIERQEKVKKEIEGTILLCANCHRIIHFG